MTLPASAPHGTRQTVRRPLAATMVGWAFILMGIFYGMSMLLDWLQGKPTLDLGACMVPVGMGLLRGSSSSQSWARLIACLWIMVGSVDLLRVSFGLWHASPHLFAITPQGWPLWLLTLTNCFLAIVSGSVVLWALSDRAYVAHLEAGDGKTSGPHESAR